MNKESAIEIQSLALSALANLSRILNQDCWTITEYESLKNGVGLSIGNIQMGILELTIAEFPELDDLPD